MTFNPSEKWELTSTASSSDSIYTDVTDDTITSVKTAPRETAKLSSAVQSARQARKRSDDIDRYLQNEAEKAGNRIKVATFGCNAEYSALWQGICACAPEEEQARAQEALDRASDKDLAEVHAYLKNRDLDPEIYRACDRRAHRRHRGGGNVEDGFDQELWSITSDARLTKDGVDEFIGKIKNYIEEEDQQWLFDKIRKYSRITHQDWLYHDQARRILREVAIPFEQLTFQFLGFSSSCCSRRKLIHVLEDSRVVVFVADLGRYDESLMEDTATTHLMESKCLFESIIASSKFKKAIFVLILVGGRRFRDRLASSPFVDFYPSFAGTSRGENEDEADACVAFLEQRFRDLNRENRELHVVVTDQVDADALRSVMTIVTGSLSAESTVQ